VAERSLVTLSNKSIRSQTSVRFRAAAALIPEEPKLATSKGDAARHLGLSTVVANNIVSFHSFLNPNYF